MTAEQSDNGKMKPSTKADQPADAQDNGRLVSAEVSVQYEKIAVLDNEVQAEALDALLIEIGIPHEMKSYRDSAMDGLYQATRGWGHVEAPLEHAEAVRQALKSLTDGPQGSTDT